MRPLMNLFDTHIRSKPILVNYAQRYTRLFQQLRPLLLSIQLDVLSYTILLQEVIRR